MILVNLLHSDQRCSSGQCPKMAVSGKRKCLRHYRVTCVQIDRTEARARARMDRGLCRSCSNSAVGGGVFCERHRLKSQASLKKYRSTETGLETNRTRDRARHISRKHNELCTTCGKPASSGLTKCTECLEADTRNTLARRVQRKTDGLCIYCGVGVARGTGRHPLTSCGDCRKRRTVYDRTYASRFSRTRSGPTARKHGWSLLLDEYIAIIVLPCNYCRLPNTTQQSGGLDRLDNKRGYHLDNVVSCCPECNMVRNNIFTPEEMKLLGEVVRQIKLARIAARENN